MPLYAKELQDLNDICKEVLDSANPYELTPTEIKDFKLVTNTLRYIVEDENIKVLKAKPKITFFPGKTEKEQLETYVPIHLERIRELAENEAKTELDIQAGVEKYLIGSLVSSFITCFNLLKTIDLERISGDELKKLIQIRIKTFCSKLSGHCIDMRTCSAFDYAWSLGVPRFSDLIGEALRDSPETDYAGAFAEILVKQWEKPFKADADSGPCRVRGKLGTDHFSLIHTYLADFFGYKLTDNIEPYKKIPFGKRPICLQFLFTYHSHLLNVKAFIKKDVNVALEIAILLNRPEWVTACLQAGANLCLLNSENQTPIEIAAAQNFWDCVTAILEYAPPDPDNTAHYGQVLAYAVAKQKTDLAKRLIKLKANVNIPHPSTKDYPIHLSLRYEERLETKEEKSEERVPTLRNMLVEAKAQLNLLPPLIAPLLDAARDPFVSPEALGWLLDQKELNINCVDVNNCTALFYAAKNLEKTEKLIKKGVNKDIKNKFGRTVQEFAALEGYFDTFFYYLSKVEGHNLSDADFINQLGSRVFQDGKTILHLIGQYNKPECLYLFTEYKTCMEIKDASGCTPIWRAGETKSWSCVEQMARLWPHCAEKGAYGAALIHAAAEKQWSVVDTLLTLNVPPNGFSLDNKQAMHYAVLSNNIPIATKILDAKFDINWMKDATVLVTAAQSPEVTQDTFEWLLEQKNINYSLKNTAGQTALYLACKTGQIHKARALMRESRAEIDVRCKESEGEKFPFEIAAELGYFDIAEMLAVDLRSTALRAKIFSKGNSLLHLAMEHKQPAPYIHKLLDAKHGKHLTTLNAESLTPIEIAAKNKLWESVEYLASIQSDAKNIAHYSQALMLAVKAKKWQVALALLSANAQTTFFDEKGYTVLHHVLLENEEKMFEELLSRRIDLYARAATMPYPTPLMIATSKCVNLSMFKRLCETKIDINLADAEGNTPLMLLATYTEEETACALAQDKVKELLKNPTLLLNAKNAKGKTAAMIAAEQENVDILNLLISEDKAWDTYQFDHGENLVHLLAKFAHEKSLDILKLLMAGEHKLDINARNSAGETALFLAAKTGPVEKIEFLLTLPGIDIQALRNPGDKKSAAAIAEENAHSDIAQLLLLKQTQDILHNKVTSLEILSQAIADCEYTLQSVIKEKNCRRVLQFIITIRDLMALAIPEGIAQNIVIDKGNIISAYSATLLFLIKGKHWSQLEFLLDNYNLHETLENVSGCLPMASPEMQIALCLNSTLAALDFLLQQTADDVSEQKTSILSKEKKWSLFYKIMKSIKLLETLSGNTLLNKPEFKTKLSALLQAIIDVPHYALANILLNISPSITVTHSEVIIERYFDSKRESKSEAKHEACTDGLPEMITKLFIRTCLSPDTKYSESESLLHLTARSHNKKWLMKALALEEFKDLNHKNSEGETALCIAAKNGNRELVNLLLTKSTIDTEAKRIPGDGRSIRNIALGNKHYYIVGIIALAAIQNIRYAPTYSSTSVLSCVISDVTEAIHAAVSDNKWEDAEELLSVLDDLGDFDLSGLDSKTQKHIDTLLLLSAKQKNWHMVKRLLKLSGNLSVLEGNKNALDYSLESKDESLISTLLQKASAEIIKETDYKGSLVPDQKDFKTVRYSDDETLLHLAARCPSPDWTRRLLQAGICATLENKHHKTPLHIASELGHWDVVREQLKTLLSAESKSESNYQTVLLEAARSEQWDIVENILPFTSNVKFRDPEGNTLLHIAIQKNAPVTSLNKLLSNPSLDFECLNPQKETPIPLALQLTPPEKIIAILKKIGLPITDSASLDQCLLKAAEAKEWGRTILLIRAGARLTAFSLKGDCAYDYAVLKTAEDTPSASQAAVISKLLELKPDDLAQTKKLFLQNELYLAVSEKDKPKLTALLRYHPQMDMNYMLPDKKMTLTEFAYSQSNRGTLAEFIDLHTLLLRVMHEKLNPLEHITLLYNSKLVTDVLQNLKLSYPRDTMTELEAVINIIVHKNISPELPETKSDEDKWKLQFKIWNNAYHLLDRSPIHNRASLLKSMRDQIYNNFMERLKGLDPRVAKDLLEFAKNQIVFNKPRKKRKKLGLFSSSDKPSTSTADKITEKIKEYDKLLRRLTR